MKNEKLEEISKIIRNKNNPFVTLGVHTDPQLQEITTLTCGELDPNSQEAKDLSKDCKLFYPAGIHPEKLQQISEIFPERLDGYSYHTKNPLIVAKDAKPTLDLAREIISHYLSSDKFLLDAGCMYGFDSATNSISQYIDPTHFEEGTLESLTQALQEFGFTTSLDEGTLNVHSDIPYPTVPKSKFQGIFDKAKGKIKNTFDKLKASIFKGKDSQEKDTQGPEI